MSHAPPHTTLFDAIMGLLPWAAALFGLAALAAGVWWVKAGATRRAAVLAESVDTLYGWAPQATRVLTMGELRAQAVLVHALPQHMILAQVSLARFIKVPTRHSYAEWLRRVGHLSADLLVCDIHSQVLAVVEVRSVRERRGERSDRRQLRFARVLKAVGIPLHVWVENAIPSADEVRRLITPKPSLAAASPPDAARAAVAPVVVEASAAAPAADIKHGQHPPPDEVIEMREPPSTTWFDEFDSAAVPLDSSKRPPSRRRF